MALYAWNIFCSEMSEFSENRIRFFVSRMVLEIISLADDLIFDFLEISALFHFT